MPVFKHLLDMLMHEREDSAVRAAAPPMPGRTNRVVPWSQKRAPEGMPLLSHDDDVLGRALKANDITAHAERGEDIDPLLYQGLAPEQIIESLGTGGQMRGMGGAPVTTFMNKVPEAQSTLLPLAPVEATPDDVRMNKAKLTDEFVQKNGYQAGQFTGKSAQAAAQIISDQLHARRAALLDPTAWWSALSTDI